MRFSEYLAIALFLVRPRRAFLRAPGRHEMSQRGVIIPPPVGFFGVKRIGFPNRFLTPSEKLAWLGIF
jgi:hypothetical protein